ncbi:hypothetical protein ACI78R_19340 [Geodermatophilus sp. SYSU D01106]
MPAQLTRSPWRRGASRGAALGLGLVVVAGATAGPALAGPDKGAGNGTGNGNGSANNGNAPGQNRPADTAPPLNPVPGTGGGNGNGQGTGGVGGSGQGATNGQGVGDSVPGGNGAANGNGNATQPVVPAPTVPTTQPTPETTPDPAPEPGPEPIVPTFGTGKDVTFTVAPQGPVPDDLDLSGTTVTLTAVDGSGWRASCTTDPAGECTVSATMAGLWEETDEERLVDGVYEAVVTGAGTGFADPAGLVLGTVGICQPDLGLVFLGGAGPDCWTGQDVAVPVQSVFRTTVTTTVTTLVGDEQVPVEGAAYVLTGDGYPSRTAVPGEGGGPAAGGTDLGSATSNAQGVLVHTGHLLPGSSWTLQPADPPAGYDPDTATTFTVAGDVSLPLALTRPLTRTPAGDGGPSDGDTGGDGDTVVPVPGDGGTGSTGGDTGSTGGDSGSTGGDTSVPDGTGTGGTPPTGGDGGTGTTTGAGPTTGTSTGTGTGTGTGSGTGTAGGTGTGTAVAPAGTGRTATGGTTSTAGDTAGGTAAESDGAPATSAGRTSGAGTGTGGSSSPAPVADAVDEPALETTGGGSELTLWGFGVLFVALVVVLIGVLRRRARRA